MLKYFLSPFAKKLYDSINETDWEFDAYHMRHKELKLASFWIANGSWFFDGEGKYSGCIGLMDRHMLWQKVKKVRKQIKQKELMKLFEGIKWETR